MQLALSWFRVPLRSSFDLNIGQGFRSVDAWDSKCTARSILLDLHASVRPLHIFGDMRDILPKKVVQTIAGLREAAEGDLPRFWRDMTSFLAAAEPDP